LSKLETAVERSESEERLWLGLVILLIVLVLVSAIRWMLTHPFAVDADEAWYANEVQIDLQVLHADGPLRLVRWIIHGDSSRPPGYRLVVLPFLAVFGYHTLLARLVSLTCFAVSSWVIYLTTRRVAGPVAGGIAALVFALSPDILSASMSFSTEGPLYLAVAVTLYCLSVYWGDGPENRFNWIFLGLAMGLGFLSKTTFVFIAIPAFAFSVFAARRNRAELLSLAKAGALGLLVAFPWWRRNLLPALAYAKYASRGFPRHSLGSHSSLLTWGRWLIGVFGGLLGPAIAILIVLIAIAYFRRAIVRKEALFEPVQRATLFGCACAGLPLLGVYLSGSNSQLTHISPTLIPLAIAIGVLSQATGWVHSSKAMAVSGVLVAAQFFMLAFPVLFPNKHAVDPGTINPFPWGIMIRSEQWDWKPLRDISESRGLNTQVVSSTGNGQTFHGQLQYGWRNPTGRPRIAYLGNGSAFNGSQIQYPWVAQGIAPPDVTWLWRYEDGPIDWQKVLNSIGQSDLVITAPNYVGQASDRQDVDNQHNAEFAQRLSLDLFFEQPIRLELGQLDPVEVLVFVKKSVHQ
jgi:4-amino-4-deoxy-L-arabinose transferase-like glycosyltransferase